MDFAQWYESLPPEDAKRANGMTHVLKDLAQLHHELAQTHRVDDNKNLPLPYHGGMRPAQRHEGLFFQECPCHTCKKAVAAIEEGVVLL